MRDDTDLPSGERTRRAVLKSGALLPAGLWLTGSSLGATGQEASVVTRAVIPEQPQFDRDELPGFFIHVDQPTSPVPAQVADECAYADWPPEASRAYDIWLIGRKANEQGSQRTTLYVPDYRTIPGGALYVINRIHRCTSGYVGIEIEQLNREGSGVLGTRNRE